MKRSAFTHQVVETIRGIPEGRVSSYGRIAALAGEPRGARQVVRILHSLSKAEQLPWHRVVNRDGEIALGEEEAGRRQRELLEAEGVVFDEDGRIDLKRFLWPEDQV